MPIYESVQDLTDTFTVLKMLKIILDILAFQNNFKKFFCENKKPCISLKHYIITNNNDSAKKLLNYKILRKYSPFQNGVINKINRIINGGDTFIYNFF